MADSTFHAKITADAGEFIQAVQASADALSTLVSQTQGAGGSIAKGATGGTKSEISGIMAQARAEQQKLHQDRLNQINSEKAARVQAAKEAAKAESSPATGTGAGDFAAGYRPGGEQYSTKEEIRNRELYAKMAKRIRDQDLRDHRNYVKEQERLARAEAKAVADRAKQVITDNRKQMDAMVTGRYALYDLSQAYDTVAIAAGAALLVGKQMVDVATQFETAFTAVEGAVQPLPDEIQLLKDSLVDLTREIPLSFAEISKIATLGAQMGIGAGSLDSFTKTVASFSAVTGSTVDETAEAFGRISSLADVATSDFENLGSAITYAGVNAVATEEQILRLTENLAAAARQANFTAPQIVGLATAMASLGIPPERARGVILRVFGDISAVVEEGGEKLNSFAEISGMSADAIRQSWSADGDPNSFFSSFLRGINRAEDKVGAFRAIGIVDTREIDVLQRLSQNMGVYSSSMEDATKSYEDGTYLAERYALTADNLASKIKILQGNFAALSDSVGAQFIAPLGILVDFLSQAVQALEAFVQTPVGQFIVPIGTMIIAVVGALALFVSMSARATAQLYAMRTAQIQMMKAGSMARGGLVELIGTMLGLVQAVELADGRIQFMTQNQAWRAGVLDKWTEASNRSVKSTERLGLAMKALGAVSAIATVVTLIGTFAEMSKSTLNLAGDMLSLRDAIQEDTKEWRAGGKAYRTFTVEVDTSNKALDEARSNIKALGGQVSEVTTKIKEQTMAYGDNTREAIRNALISNEKINEMLNNYRAAGNSLEGYLGQIGGSFDEMIQASLQNPDGAVAYIEELKSKLAEQPYFTTDPDAYGALNALLKIAGEIDGALVVASNTAKNSDLFSGGYNPELEDTNFELKTLVDRIKELSTLLNEDLAMEDALYGLGAALRENGNEWNIQTVAGRANMEALQQAVNNMANAAGEDSRLFAANVRGLRDAMIKAGYEGGAAIEYLESVLNSLNLKTDLEIWDVMAGAAAVNGKNDFQSFLDGLDDVTTSSGTAKTALEKLQETLEKLYSFTNKRIELNSSLQDLGEAFRKNGATFSIWSEAGQENVNSLLDVIDQMAIQSNGNLQKFANYLMSLRQAMINMGAPASALKYIDDALAKVGKKGKASAKEVDRLTDSLLGVADTRSQLLAVQDAIEGIASGMQDEFSAYFAQANAIDDITLGWLDMADAAEAAQDQIDSARETIEDATQAINEAKASIQELAADRGVLEYQLAIALKYGDTLRAEQLRAEINSINQDIASEQDSIQDAQETIAEANQEIRDAQGELGQNSTVRQQIERNQLLQDMGSKYLDVAAAMLYNAEEGADLNAIINGQVGEFEAMAREAGYSEEQIKTVADAMRLTLTNAINNLPKNPVVTVSAQTAAALSQISNFVNQANARLRQIISPTISVGTGGGGGGGNVIALSQGGLVQGPGSATSDSIAAKLSNGEFVMKASAVKYYGADFMNAVNNSMLPQRSMAVQATVASGAQTVYLSTEDRQLLRAAIDRPVNLYTDNATIAKSANEGNAILARRGVR